MEKRSFYVKFIIKIPSASLFKNNRLLCAVCARFYTCVCVRAHTAATTTTSPTNILKFIIMIHEKKELLTAAQTHILDKKQQQQ